MKKSLLWLALPTIWAVTACSADETVDSSPVNPDEIRFDVIQNNISRAAEMFSSSALPESFNLFATVNSDGSPYIGAYTSGSSTVYGTPVVKVGTNSYKLKSGTRYWPYNSATLDFFAFRAYSGTSELTTASYNTTDGVTISGIDIPPTVASQHDILYASTFNAAKTSNGSVSLTLNHALAQLAFKAKCASRGIYVQIKQISLGYVKNQGTLTFGQSSSSPGCSWSDLATTSGTMSWNFMPLTSPVVVYPGWNASSKTMVEMNPVNIANTTDGTDGVMFVIPQTINPWVPSAASNALQSCNNGGQTMMFYLFANVRNVADIAAGPQDSDVYVYGSSSTSPSSNGSDIICIPVPNSAFTAWEPGKKYTYTFTFGETGGTNCGYQFSAPTTPALVPVSVTTSVESWGDSSEKSLE